VKASTGNPFRANASIIARLATAAPFESSR
jgi:hypothetical protein